MGCLYSIFNIFIFAAYFLFGTIWGWLIIIAFILPPVLAAAKRRSARISRIAHLKSNLINKSNADARFELGTIFRKMRKNGAALKMLEEAYSISSGERKIFLALADAALASKNAKRALDVLDKAKEIDLRESKDEFFTLRGRAYLALGNPGDAEADFREAISKNGSNIEARFWLAKSLKARGAHNEAKAAVAELKETYAGLPPFGKKRHRKWYFKSFFA